MKRFDGVLFDYHGFVYYITDLLLPFIDVLYIPIWLDVYYYITEVNSNIYVRRIYCGGDWLSRSQY